MMFQRYIGIDYSGAGAPTKPQNGIQVLQTLPGAQPELILNAGGQNWSRIALAAWIAERLVEPLPTLVGLDHCFSFPLSFLKQHRLKTWDAVLDFADAQWNTRSRIVASVVNWQEFATFTGRAGFRLTEQFTPSAKSVFNPHGAGVAHSSFAGLPWLRDLRRTLRGRVHFWPFDGWEMTGGKTCIAEVYPSLFSRRYDNAGHPGGPHSHDAYAVCRWMMEADADGTLSHYFQPPLTLAVKEYASTEGWILGVT